MNVCRFCGSTVLPKLCVGLFSKEGLEKDLPGRVSRVVDLPVSREDGLSPHSCMPCMRKFQAAEAFRSLARSSYEKRGYSQAPPPHPVHTPGAHGSRKRTKSTSGFEASPHTLQATPSAKHSTIAVAGRRLAFTPSENSKIHNHHVTQIVVVNHVH